MVIGHGAFFAALLGRWFGRKSGGDLGKDGVVPRIQWGLQHFTRVSSFFEGCAGFLEDGFFLLANQGFETTNPKQKSTDLV